MAAAIKGGVMRRGESKTSLGIARICLLACVVLGTLALGAGSASAAGKPTSVAISNTHEINGYTVLEITAKVNPNGANTATTIELRGEGGVTWTIKGEVHNLSGTMVRTYSEEITVAPETNYEARVFAKNSFGTGESPIIKGVSTRIRTTGEEELNGVSFGSEGTASFAIVWGGVPINVFCEENSYGSIGNAGGVNDVYHYSMSGCISFINGKEATKCKIENFTFTLGGPTLAIQNTPYIPIPGNESCAPEADWWILPNAFRVVDNGSYSEYGKSRSVVLSATGIYGTGVPAEVIIESNWYMSGEYVNTPFKIADTGL